MKIRNQTPFKPKRSPKIQKKNKSVKTSPTKTTSQKNTTDNFIEVSDNKSTVVYLGSIPHGFYEREMKKYFSQFGKVLRTRVARSRKTGRSKGYGFIEFSDGDVARIVAETMNNYLMNKRVLKAKVIPAEEDHGKYFMGNAWSEKKHPTLLNRKKSISTKNKRVNDEKARKLKLRKLERLDKLKNKLSTLGYSWDPEIIGLPSNKNSPSKVIDVPETSNSDSENSSTDSSKDEEIDSEDEIELQESENENTTDEENILSENEIQESYDENSSDELENESNSSENDESNYIINKKNQSKLLQRKSDSKVMKRRKNLTGKLISENNMNKRKLKMAASDLMMSSDGKSLKNKGFGNKKSFKKK